MKLHLKQSTDSGGEESALLDIPGTPSDWSRDGQWIVYGPDTLQIVAASGAHKPFPFISTRFRQGGGRFAPDGKWLVYASNETGRFEVFVRRFAGAPAEAEGAIQVSDGGGDFPVWRPDGQELYYMSGDFTVYAVATSDLGGTGTVGPPQRLFRACPGTVPWNRPMRGESYGTPFDTLDGQRFLVNCASRPPGESVVLMNWSPAGAR